MHAEELSDKLNEVPGGRTARRIVILALASLIMAFNIKCFVNTAELYPGGISGLSLLIQRSLARFAGVNLPYSPIYLTLNIPPLYIGFRYIGKNYTLFSMLVVIMVGILTDLIPSFPITYDPILLSVFGGILSGLGGVLCYWNDANGGGTDFVATWLSIKRNVDSWDIIMGFNVVLILIAGAIYGWEKSLYSIIFQYASTQTVHVLYKKYQQQTLFIVTDKPKEIVAAIYEMAGHGATILHGEGAYQGQIHSVVYSVVSREESGKVMKRIRDIDKAAFVNAFRTERVDGAFYSKPAK